MRAFPEPYLNQESACRQLVLSRRHLVLSRRHPLLSNHTLALWQQGEAAKTGARG